MRPSELNGDITLLEASQIPFFYDEAFKTAKPIQTDSRSEYARLNEIMLAERALRGHDFTEALQAILTTQDHEIMALQDAGLEVFSIPQEDYAEAMKKIERVRKVNELTARLGKAVTEKAAFVAITEDEEHIILSAMQLLLTDITPTLGEKKAAHQFMRAMHIRVGATLQTF